MSWRDDKYQGHAGFDLQPHAYEKDHHGFVRRNGGEAPKVENEAEVPAESNEAVSEDSA